MELIAADTDLLIMLVYFWDSLMGQIIMKTETTKKHGSIERHIGKIADRIDVVRKYLTFAHAFGGCDTTAVYGKGELSILKLLEKSVAAREEADVFLQKDRSPETICKAGIRIFVMLYGENVSDSLTDHRFLKYMKMISSSTSIKPECLPPTERAAMFHAYRLYFQLQEWNTVMESALDPQDWGWRLEGNSLVPVMTDTEPAPDELLNVIRCGCRATSKNPVENSVLAAPTVLSV